MLVFYRAAAPKLTEQHNSHVWWQTDQYISIRAAMWTRHHKHYCKFWFYCLKSRSFSYKCMFLGGVLVILLSAIDGMLRVLYKSSNRKIPQKSTLASNYLTLWFLISLWRLQPTAASLLIISGTRVPSEEYTVPECWHLYACEHYLPFFQMQLWGRTYSKKVTCICQTFMVKKSVNEIMDIYKEKKVFFQQMCCYKPHIFRAASQNSQVQQHSYCIKYCLTQRSVGILLTLALMGAFSMNEKRKSNFFAASQQLKTQLAPNIPAQHLWLLKFTLLTVVFSWSRFI